MSIEIRYTSKNQKRYKVRIEYKGKRVSSKTFIKRSDAILYERNALAELQKTGHIVDHSAQAVMSFRDALAKYKNEVSINKKGYRQESYRIKALQDHKLAAYIDQCTQQRYCQFHQRATEQRQLSIHH